MGRNGATARHHNKQCIVGNVLQPIGFRHGGGKKCGSSLRECLHNSLPRASTASTYEHQRAPTHQCINIQFTGGLHAIRFQRQIYLCLVSYSESRVVPRWIISTATCLMQLSAPIKPWPVFIDTNNVSSYLQVPRIYKSRNSTHSFHKRSCLSKKTAPTEDGS